MPKLTYEHINETQFEEFVFELMEALGFVNVDWRKGTPKKSSPADRGRDIVAQQLKEDIDGSKTLETWFVDCKHYQKGIPPTELQNLLSWAEAERPDIVLFVASGFLSNGAKDYLDAYKRNNRPAFKIKHWELPQLERITRGKVTLLRRHRLTEAPIRDVKQILAAEAEFFDRIWYDRSLIRERKDKNNGLKRSADIIKGMLAARKRIEEKYGGRKALLSYYQNDFEWGMMNGKLSALRWVLGDDWDMLDT